MIVGNVLDDEQQPIEGALVTIVELQRNTTTDDLGDYRFLEVPVGRYTVEAEHPRFNGTPLKVEVRANAPSQAFFAISSKAAPTPFNFTRELNGEFECAAEAFIITGPCWTLAEGVTCRVQCVADPFDSKYQFKVDIGSGWETIIAELTWTTGAGTLDGMRMYLENANVSQQGLHGKGVAKVYGNQQGLKIRIDRGQTHPTAETYDGTSVKAFVPDDGPAQQIRVFPKGQGYDYTKDKCLPDYGCFLGAGVGSTVTFAIQFTVFYYEAAPAGFTALD